jgi:hypothetical protein
MLWRAYRCPDHRGNGQCRQNCCHDRRFASHGRDRQFLSPNCRISTRRAKQYSRYKTLMKSHITESPLAAFALRRRPHVAHSTHFNRKSPGQGPVIEMRQTTWEERVPLPASGNCRALSCPEIWDDSTSWLRCAGTGRHKPATPSMRRRG